MQLHMQMHAYKNTIWLQYQSCQASAGSHGVEAPEMTGPAHPPTIPEDGDAQVSLSHPAQSSGTRGRRGSSVGPSVGGPARGTRSQSLVIDQQAS